MINNTPNMQPLLFAQKVQNPSQTENRKRTHSSEVTSSSLSTRLRTSIDSNENSTAPNTTTEAIRQLSTINHNTENLSIDPSIFLEQVLTTEGNSNNSASESIENHVDEDYLLDSLSETNFNDPVSSINSLLNMTSHNNSLHEIPTYNQLGDYMSSLVAISKKRKEAAAEAAASSNNEFTGNVLNNDDFIDSLKYISLENFKNLLSQRTDLLENINTVIESNEMGGCTCLLWAVDAGRLDIIQYLVEEKQAEIDSQDNLDYGCYPSLYRAMEADFLKIAEYLASKGALLNAPFALCEEPWDTLLSYHCYSSNFTKLQFIVETLKADIHAPNKLGRTPLSSTLKRITFFSKYDDGVNQETIDLYKSTGLPPTIVKKCKQIAKVVLYLINHGADVNEALEYLNEKKKKGDSSAEITKLALEYILDLGASSYLKSSLSRELGINRLTWIGHNL